MIRTFVKGFVRGVVKSCQFPPPAVSLPSFRPSVLPFPSRPGQSEPSLSAPQDDRVRFLTSSSAHTSYAFEIIPRNALYWINLPKVCIIRSRHSLAQKHFVTSSHRVRNYEDALWAPCGAGPHPVRLPLLPAFSSVAHTSSHQTCQPEWVCERSLLCYFSAFPSPCPLAGNKVPFHDPRLPELQKDYVAESQAGAGGGWWRWWRQEAGRVKDQATRQVIVLDHSSPRHGALEAKPSN